MTVQELSDLLLQTLKETPKLANTELTIKITQWNNRSSGWLDLKVISSITELEIYGETIQLVGGNKQGLN